MKWIDNIKNVTDGNPPGRCPCCGSLRTDYTAVPISGDLGYCTVWCNDCKRAYNISRIRITKDMAVSHKIPNDLIF